MRIFYFIILLYSIQANAGIKLAEERLLLHTNYGDLVLVLYPEIAPKHVEQILKLVKLGVYDGLNIHRVEKGFVVQISNEFDRIFPISQEQRLAIHKIPAEYSNIPHTRGELSMARGDDDPNGAEVSFSILLGNAPHLDGKYTIFGRLEQGQDVLEAIEKVSVGAEARPKRKVTVLSAIALKQSELAKLTLQHPGPELSAERIQAEEEQKSILVFLLFTVILIFSLIISLLSAQYNREKTSLAQILVLISGIGIYFTADPILKNHGWFGGIIFFGFVAIFKLLGRFEAPEK